MSANHHENNGVDRQRIEELAVLATTRGLDQLTADEEAMLVSALSKPTNQELLNAAEQSSRLAAAVAAAVTANELPAPSAELRVAIEAELDANLVAPANVSTAKASTGAAAKPTRRVNWYGVAAALLAVAGTIAIVLLPPAKQPHTTAHSLLKVEDLQTRVTDFESEIVATKERLEQVQAARRIIVASQDSAESNTDKLSSAGSHYGTSNPAASKQAPADPARTDFATTAPVENRAREGESGVRELYEVQPTTTAPAAPYSAPAVSEVQLGKQSTKDRFHTVGGMSTTGIDTAGRRMPEVRQGLGENNAPTQAFSIVPNSVDGSTPVLEAKPQQSVRSEGLELYYGHVFRQDDPSARLAQTEAKVELREVQDLETRTSRQRDVSGEAYAPIRENAFRIVRDEPLSTFSIDVDTASYANVRRFLTAGRLPPKDAVRIEELLNYFSYDYPQPQEKDPFSVNMEVTECPWRPENRLLRVGLKGRDVPRQQRAASNLVFLIDVSGSMQPENKLPLIKTALRMLVQELTENDRVSIVTYAGDAGLKLPSTNGTEQSRILGTIDSLTAGGSTHGSAGIALAYEQASAYFITGGTNRVILLTDGDLNVGITDDDALVQLIQQKAKTGVFLTVLGVGDGNLKDSKMEKLADHGNGVYAYLDGVREARKVLVEQMSGSLITIAKDVKLQIEFNPAQVQAYRLVGYENRVLANRDFHDDTKDAGEIGAGHTVTALYELVPTTAAVPAPGEPLKYQPPRTDKTSVEETPATRIDQASRELLTLKLRFKQPEADRSELRDYPLTDRGGKFGQASTDFRFASSVAMFGLVLRDSQYRGNATLSAVEEIATSSLGSDSRGYRSEFVDLVRRAEQLK